MRWRTGIGLVMALAAGFAGGCSTVVRAGSPQAAPAPAQTPPPPESGAEPAAAPEPLAAHEPEVYKNRVKWTTASEVDNFGYDVYRSESADGPFEVLNSEVIEGAGTVDEPTSYEFVDDTIDPRKAYHYFVESISMSGVRERFTPVIRAAPKIAPDEAEASAASGGEG